MAERADGERSLTAATLAGIRWTYISLAASGLVQIVFTIVVSRLIEPREFGLYAMLMTVVVTAQLFGQLGLGPAVIQAAEISDDLFRSVFWFGAALAAVLSATLTVLSKPLASALGEPGSWNVLAVLASTFLLNGIATAPAAYVRRTFGFSRLARAEILSSVFGYLIVGIAAAAIGLGVWALVASTIVYPLVRAALLIWPLRTRLRFRLRIGEVRPLLRFGATLSLVGLVQQLSSSAMVISMARMHGTGAAGQQSRANSIVQPVLYRTVMAFSTVLFPAFSAIRTDGARLYRAKHEALLVAGAAFVPACAIGAVVAPEAVDVLLGPGWGLAADMLPWILLYVAASLTGHFHGIAVDARGYVGAKLTLEVSYLIALILTLALLGRESPLALVAATAVLRVGWAVAYALLTAAAVHTAAVLPIRLLLRLGLGGLIVFGGTHIVRRALLGVSDEFPPLGLATICGVAGTMIASSLWWRGMYSPARAALSRRLLESPSTRRIGVALGERAG